MPQMSPLMWFNLFIMFLLSLALFTVFNYFIFPPRKISIFPQQPKQVQKNWKW
uniref:ATP synthase F0 subunit 8 n=1 Tax=Panulirus versicolor TaxID=150436 RepID=L0E731_PANVR|nr:ATP synthase F0 subunit 8 [Panulirus versicolor]AGA56067.1 ATP synthase F0 subunit 8 [Panulirus versicolor]